MYTRTENGKIRIYRYAPEQSGKRERKIGELPQDAGPQDIPEGIRDEISPREFRDLVAQLVERQRERKRKAVVALIGNVRTTMPQCSAADLGPELLVDLESAMRAALADIARELFALDHHDRDDREDAGPDAPSSAGWPLPQEQIDPPPVEGDGSRGASGLTPERARSEANAGSSPDRIDIPDRPHDWQAPRDRVLRAAAHLEGDVAGALSDEGGVIEGSESGAASPEAVGDASDAGGDEATASREGLLAREAEPGTAPTQDGRGAAETESDSPPDGFSAGDQETFVADGALVERGVSRSDDLQQMQVETSLRRFGTGGKSDSDGPAADGDLGRHGP